jgi:hypothetical protein
VGELPSDVQGTSRIYRGGEVLWEKPFVSGEDNMSHYIHHLEHHHFKCVAACACCCRSIVWGDSCDGGEGRYKQFCRPGDLHVHFFGTATLSYSDEIRTQKGDIFEIEAAPFVAPLVRRACNLLVVQCCR